MTHWITEALYAALCVAWATFLTWPLVAIFTTRVAGDPGDPFQTLWGMRWMHDALLSLQNPFFTHRLYHPFGSTLVFQTFDIPSALLVLPLWGLLPYVAIYNAAVLAAVSFSTYGMFRLARELTDDTLVALLSGALYAATPYLSAHLQGHLHLISMGWIPLYLMYLLRVIRGPASFRDGVLAGFFLALASLASWYNLVYAIVLTPALFGYGAIVHGAALLSRRTLRAAFALAATYFVLAGPLLVAMSIARAHTEITGAHDASTFSADLYSFVFPNAAQSWSESWGAHFRHWTGNPTENAAYVGVTVLGLALVGGLAHSLARAFVVAAVIGTVLALGPYLHVDGHIVLSTKMPYWYFERVVTPVQFMGVPVRFGYVMYLGLIVAAAFGLRRLRTLGATICPLLGITAVLVSFTLALYEYRPRQLITWEYHIPAPMRAWAHDRGTWAVIDVWDYYRPMWHATIHRKPMVGGYLSRVPKGLEDWTHEQPVLRSIMWPGDEWNDRRIPAVAGVGRERGRAMLRDLDVRYVITNQRPNICIQQELGLPLIYNGEGVWIYGVPEQ